MNHALKTRVMQAVRSLYSEFEGTRRASSIAALLEDLASDEAHAADCTFASDTGVSFISDAADGPYPELAVRGLFGEVMIAFRYCPCCGAKVTT